MWCAVGILYAGAMATPAPLVPILIAVGLVSLAYREGRKAALRSAESRRRIGRVVALWSGAEVVAIVIVANLLGATGHVDQVLPAIGLIVAVHFLPLARWLPFPAFYPVGLAMAVVAIIGFFIGPVPTRMQFVAFGEALILWAAALAVIRAVKRSPRTLAQGSWIAMQQGS